MNTAMRVFRSRTLGNLDVPIARLRPGVGGQHAGLLRTDRDAGVLNRAAAWFLITGSEDPGGAMGAVQPGVLTRREGEGAVGERTYLIRYGVMSQVGRFAALPECDAPFERGQVVVIQSHRGTELGEVLIRHDIPVPAQTGWEARPAGEDSSSAQEIEQPRVLRLAGPEDLTRSERAQQARPSRFMLCQRVLDEGNWPWELIDVEPLLDDRTTVLHYLGPHRLDVASLRHGSEWRATSTWCSSPPAATMAPFRMRAISTATAKPGADRAIVAKAGAAGAGRPRMEITAHRQRHPGRMARRPRRMAVVRRVESVNCWRPALDKRRDTRCPVTASLVPNIRATGRSELTQKPSFRA